MDRLIYVILVAVNLSSCNDSSNYYADNIKIFQNTPVWELANAIYNHDTSNIKKLLEEYPDWVNYKEPKFEISLLYWTLNNSHYYKLNSYNIKIKPYYNEAEILIRYGANPYFKNNDNETPIMMAAGIHSESASFITLCLNSKYTLQLPDSLKRILLSEALTVACGKIIEEVEGVKLLVEEGADINYFNIDSTETPLSQSLIHNNIVIGKYLIIEKGAKVDYNIKFMVDKTDWSVLKILRNLDFSDEPEKEKTKQEILSYIEEQEK